MSEHFNDYIEKGEVDAMLNQKDEYYASVINSMDEENMKEYNKLKKKYDELERSYNMAEDTLNKYKNKVSKLKEELSIQENHFRDMTRTLNQEIEDIKGMYTETTKQANMLKAQNRSMKDYIVELALNRKL